jgi:hypothetical protein
VQDNAGVERIANQTVQLTVSAPEKRGWLLTILFRKAEALT